MSKNSTSTSHTTIPEELQVTIIKKVKDQYSQQIKMKLSGQTSFGCIIDFMNEQGLLKTKDVIVRPAHNQSFVISFERKIIECYNLIQLKFIVEEVENGKQKSLKNKYGNIQALRNKANLIEDERERNNICGKEQCKIM